MKSGIVIASLIVASAAAWGQAGTATKPAPTQPPAQSTARPATQQAPSAAPAPQQPGAAQPSGNQRQALQAKTQEEFKAYQDASGKSDPGSMEAAADAFAKAYPDSVLRGPLYVKTMNFYAQANAVEKMIAVGRKAIAVDATDPVPLVQVASALAESTRDTDLDREERLAEASKDAKAAIANIDTGLLIPAGTPEERIAAVKASILTRAYDSLGMIDLNRKDYPAAEQDLLKAIAASKSSPEAVVYLRLSVAQDHMNKYPEALDNAGKALQYAPEGSAAQNLAKQQQTRLQKLIAGGTPAPATPAPAPNANAPATPPPATQTPAAPAPHQ
jgi:tetratricopeptide (TPR) repeat protein